MTDVVNVGTLPDDGTGDTYYVAFTKINAALATVLAHIQNTANPHGVTAKQANAATIGAVKEAITAAITALTLGAAATKALGASVGDPGTGKLEFLMPVSTVTGTSLTLAANHLFTEVRRSNGGVAMADTMPAPGTAGLVNGATLTINNVDASAVLTLSPIGGGAITISGTAVTSVAVGPGRSTRWVYDAAVPTWRPTMNTLSGLLASNALSEIQTAGLTAQSAARTNLGLGNAATATIGSGVQAWDADLDAIAALATTAIGRSLLAAVDAGALRNILALGTAAVLTAGIAAGNVPVLDANGKLLASTMPSLAITDVFPVSSQAAMLALTAQRGDVAVRTDQGTTYILATDDPTTLANWIALPLPAGVVMMVAGLSGPNITAPQLFSALGLGTAATKNVGTAAGNVVQLDAGARLPAVDGSQLINLPGQTGGVSPAFNFCAALAF